MDTMPLRLGLLAGLLATLLGCAWRPGIQESVPRPTATDGVPETRALRAAAGEWGDLLLKAADAGFNTVIVRGLLTQEITSQAHRLGLDAWAEPDASRGSLPAAVSPEGIVADSLVSLASASGEADLESLRARFPGARLALTLNVESGRGEPSEWAEDHLADQLIVAASPSAASAEAALPLSARNFPCLVVLPPPSEQSIAGARRVPAEGVLLDAATLRGEDWQALRAGPFAEPAFPPSRDWRLAMERAIAQAASAEDKPELIAGGIASLQRALATAGPTDLQLHRVLDFLLEMSPEPTLCRRHLEFALMCLRQAQREQLSR